MGACLNIRDVRRVESSSCQGDIVKFLIGDDASRSCDSDHPTLVFACITAFVAEVITKE